MFRGLSDKNTLPAEAGTTYGSGKPGPEKEKGLRDFEVGATVQDRTAADGDAVTQVPAEKFSTAWGDLPREKVGFAQALGPERD